jgi:NAD(P)H-flavin reductase
MNGAGVDYASATAISEEAGISRAELYIERQAPAAAKDPQLRRGFFRGHRIDERVCGLLALSPDTERVLDEAPAVSTTSGDFEIVEKREIVPNTHEIVVSAPNVARKAEPGQFVIVMADKQSERVPYTLCDWDAERGTITLVVQEKGQSSRKLILKKKGENLAHLVGPLGIPFEVKKYGTVYLAGGCYGIGAIVPLAKALKRAGNRVVAVAEARSHYMTYYQEKLSGLADEFVQTTVDGSLNMKGHAVDAISARLTAGEKIDCVVAVGCPFMMMLTADATRPFGVKTFAALNPIMVDGTGMCGACRVSVGDQTKFACVDGPFFDAHLVDWLEVRDRRAAYSADEIQSVGRTEPVVAMPHHHHHGGKQCMCSKGA